jgi:hypothetical protein
MAGMKLLLIKMSDNSLQHQNAHPVAQAVAVISAVNNS